MLEVLIALAKNFTLHFLPYRRKPEDPNKSDAKKREESNCASKDEGPSTSGSKSKQDASTDFWELLVKLDSINVCKKGKGLARSHSCSGSSNMEEEQNNLPLEKSPLGLLLEQLAHPVIKRSAILTDKLLKLLALVCTGLSNSSTVTNASLQPTHEYTQENLEALERLFGLAIQVRLLN